MKKRIIVLLLAIILSFTYVKYIKPYKLELSSRDRLRNKWDMDIDKSQKIRFITKNKPDWYGEHQKYILFELNNLNIIYDSIISGNLHLNKMTYDFKKRIIQIENDLKVEDKHKIDFSRDYYYSKREKYVSPPSRGVKKDILYMILFKDRESDNAKLYFIEDLNVLVLESNN